MSISEHVWLLVAIFGLTAMTFITRSFFLLTPAHFEFSPMIQRALRYAPMAAIVAVIAPDVLMQGGAVDLSLHNKALFASALAGAAFMWRQSLLLMIGVGMLVYTLLRLGLGW
ncbi:AzlD domain-containing protein [Hydromonas duriensis]|uniref:Branched-subunit amino acid transport protein n=1 Tax=Hydromonas duriensis TaxID=1527608 RepID=A0A4R6Y9Q8_9BURK|nr:AzlD domain-containing protein [Hydromonas duriensis]TDR32226.1 branched-subunit amino acid transport protein [Hydromonas duriensis]